MSQTDSGKKPWPYSDRIFIFSSSGVFQCRCGSTGGRVYRLGVVGADNIWPGRRCDITGSIICLAVSAGVFLSAKKLASYYHDRAAALGAADAILEILELRDPAVQDGRNNAHQDALVAETVSTNGLPVIALQNVSKCNAKRVVLDKVSLQIYPGEKIALVGETGSALSQHRAGKLIAWVGQNPYVFYGSIYENIALSKPRPGNAAVFDAAQAAGVLDFTGHSAPYCTLTDEFFCEFF